MPQTVLYFNTGFQRVGATIPLANIVNLLRADLDSLQEAEDFFRTAAIEGTGVVSGVQSQPPPRHSAAVKRR
jgi:hypothetical protein